MHRNLNVGFICLLLMLFVTVSTIRSELITTDSKINSPNILCRQIENGNLDKVQKLLKVDAKPVFNLNSSIRYPLECAVEAEQKGIAAEILATLKALENNKASFFNAAIASDMVGKALHYAIDKQQIDMTNILLDSGRGQNYSNNSGTNLLMLAAKNCELSATERLLKNGLKVSAEDQAGRIALHHAVSSGCFSTSNALLNFKADINHPDNYGTTPLMLAAGIRNENIINLLLNRGADRSMVDKNGLTAFGHAAQGGSDTIERIFLNKGLVDKDGGKLVNEQDWQEKVISLKKISLVTFHDSTQPSIQLLPSLQQSMASHPNVNFFRVYGNPGLAASLGVKEYPTVLIIKNGQVVDRFLAFNMSHRLISLKLDLIH